MKGKFFCQKKCLFLLICLSAFLFPNYSRANNTTELWNYRAIDFEFYITRGQLTSPMEKASFTNTLLLGYGLHPKFSFYLGTNISADGFLSNSKIGVFGGFFTTAIDTELFDLDLFFQVDASGNDGVSLLPQWELNLDLWGKRFGLYNRTGLQMKGVTGQKMVSLDLHTLFGSYVTIAKVHQLLLEARMGLPLNGQQSGNFKFKALSLGYNVYLNSEIELISEVFLEFPGGNKGVDVGLTLGFIATFSKK